MKKFYLVLYLLLCWKSWGNEIKVLETIGESFFQFSQGPFINLAPMMHIPEDSMVTTSKKGIVVLNYKDKGSIYLNRNTQFKIHHSTLELYLGRIHVKKMEKKFILDLLDDKYECRGKDILAYVFDFNYKLLVLDGFCQGKVKIEKNQVYEKNADKIIMMDESVIKKVWIKRIYKSWYGIRKSKVVTNQIMPLVQSSSWEKLLKRQNILTREKYQQVSKRISLDHEKTIKETIKNKKIKEKTQKVCRKEKRCVDYKLENYRGKIIESCIKWISDDQNTNCATHQQE